MNRGDPSEPAANDATIDLRIESLDRLFHSLDPAPLGRRALSPEVSSYLLEQAAEGRKGAPVAVRIRLPGTDLRREREIQEAFRLHFERVVVNARRRLREHFARGAVMVLVALACAAVLLIVARVIADLSGSRVLATMARWLTVVIWVVLWRPTEILLHDWWPIRHDKETARRLSRARVSCVPLDGG